MDPLPLIGFWVVVAFTPITLLLIGLLFWKLLRSNSNYYREMTVPRWIGFGLGIVTIVVILGFSLIERLGSAKP